MENVTSSHCETEHGSHSYSNDSSDSNLSESEDTEFHSHSKNLLFDEMNGITINSVPAIVHTNNSDNVDIVTYSISESTEPNDTSSTGACNSSTGACSNSSTGARKAKYLDDVLTELKLGLFQYKMLILSGGGYFAACSEILVFVFLSGPCKKEWNLSEYEYPWLPFFSGIAGIIGGYVFGTISDRYGRQKPFIISIGICAVFGIGSAFAPSFELMVAIRSMVSIGVGGLEAVDFVLLLVLIFSATIEMRPNNESIMDSEFKSFKNYNEKEQLQLHGGTEFHSEIIPLVEINGRTEHSGPAETKAENVTDSLLEPQSRVDKSLDDILIELKLGLFQYQMLILTGGAYFAVCAQFLVFVYLSGPLRSEWSLSEFEYPWLPFCTGVSGMFGSYVFGTISDRFGRQKAFLISMGLCSTFGLASAFASSFLLIIVIRSLLAIGIGGLVAVDFVLLIEFLPPTNRGAMMVAITFFGALGAVLTGGLAWLIIPRWGWRWFVGAAAIPSICVFLLRFIIAYESPRYLFISGRKEEGIKLLKKIAKANKTKLSTDDIICEKSEERGCIMDLFSKEYRVRTIFVSIVWCLQSTGYWGVTIYLPEYIASLGVDSYFNMFTIFLGELPGLVFAMILIEKHMLGRIRCLKFFALATSICLVLFAFIPLDFLKAVIVIVCYFFMVPIYSVLNTFTPELYPTKIRSTAMGWVNIIIEIPGLITPFVGAVLLSSKIKWLYPVVWAVNFFVQFLFCYGFSIETAGVNLFAKPKLKQEAKEKLEPLNSGGTIL